MVTGAIDQPEGPARVRAIFRLELSAVGDVRLTPIAVEGMGGRLPTGTAESIRARSVLLNKRIAQQLPSGSVRRVYVERKRVVFEIEG